MTAAVRLRPLRWWDIAAVAELERTLFPVDAWTPGQFWSELAHVPQTRTYVLAEDGEGIVGYAGLYAVPPDADVQTVAVAKHAQGRGVGGLLLDALVADASVRGCTRIVLEVRDDNVAAQNLYDRTGFTRVARRRGYYPDGGDAVVMERRVPAPEAVGAARGGP